MKEVLLNISENRPLTNCIFYMKLSGDVSDITSPGQFINIRVNGLFLRRPISVYDLDEESVSIIYRVVGKGTEFLSKMSDGILSVLTGLGNGYDTTLSGPNPLLVGGGVGVPPLYYLAKKLIEEKKNVRAVLGFRNSSDVFAGEDFKSIGVKTTIVTEDGSTGVHGYVTDYLPADCSYCFTCGPEPMLKAVYKTIKCSGQFSFEERMGCGFGVCMGCSCKTVAGPKRICVDGPVLTKEEIIWED